ncbi:uncharacterized protein K460DRAFT_394371 [Cucurbitaria berberidis CBS 394.84]|uniref:Cyclase n=1 Tax=Cucurbitaria berberidis CBS 394.84 TaxID=1168544 RepID=A0A9P4GFN0_9PLEO|nr:uncharacterized protein K460DRAFT_394371 [Cucurbitaria berberidis CBS 394.84]KAF1844497.1 hypothetical protein K460DRAFT_394371 [Cucurbitaria berberidis CBS 394.84]
MTEPKNTASQRLTQIKDFLTMNKTATTIPWDPNSTIFPTRKELPNIPGAPAEAAWVWGENDYIGRLNLLTPTRVAAAAKEIRSGEIVPVNLPLNVPNQPAFGRETFKHEIKTLAEGVVYDDLYSLNTQSGTQWDGFRHFAHIPSGSFYNGTKGSDITGPTANHKCSIHHWAEHGIAGRGVLLDYRGYAHKKGINYDPFDYYPISWEELYQCGKDQGIDIRPAAQGGDIKPGDMLFIRSGWKEAYDGKSDEDRSKAALRHGTGKDGEDGLRYAGLSQEQKILDWLHDSYFASVAGDAPAFEAWPTHEDYHLHEYILSLWGMPLGEMLDLEKLAQTCHEKNRWFFFFSSAPANCPGGVGSHVNGTAIF